MYVCIYVYVCVCLCIHIDVYTYMYIYIHIYIYIYVYIYIYIYGIFAGQDFDMCLRSCCADSSSPQISGILVGNFTGETESLRKLSAKLPQTIRRTSD